MLNLIVLMGRATKDPEVRKVDDMSIVNFDLAVDNIRKESDGSQSTSFFKVTCFGKIADNTSKFVRKGSKIAIQGSIVQRNYLTAGGEKRSTYDVIADSVEFLDPKPVEEKLVEPKNEELPFEKEESKPVDEKVPAFDPYTGKPLKPNSKK